MAGEEASGAVFQVAGFTFFADFDSGNLGHVRQDELEEEELGEEEEEPVVLQPRPSTSGGLGRSVGADPPHFR